MWHAMFENDAFTDATFWSPAITLQDRLNVHGLEYKITGAGTLNLDMYTSISGEVWILNGRIGDNLGVGSGPGANGSDLLPLIIKPGDLIKFCATSTGAVVLSAWFTQK